MNSDKCRTHGRVNQVQVYFSIKAVRLILKIRYSCEYSDEANKSRTGYVFPCEPRTDLQLGRAEVLHYREPTCFLIQTNPRTVRSHFRDGLPTTLGIVPLSSITWDQQPLYFSYLHKTTLVVKAWKCGQNRRGFPKLQSSRPSCFCQQGSFLLFTTRPRHMRRTNEC